MLSIWGYKLAGSSSFSPDIEYPGKKIPQSWWMYVGQLFRGTKLTAINSDWAYVLSSKVICFARSSKLSKDAVKSRANFVRKRSIFDRDYHGPRRGGNDDPVPNPSNFDVFRTIFSPLFCPLSSKAPRLIISWELSSIPLP